MSRGTHVVELHPGDVIEGHDGRRAAFIAKTDHPLYRTLMLVLWRLEDGTLSPDALSSMQDVGERVPATMTPDEVLREALQSDSTHPAWARR